MLITVLKNDVTINFRNYGNITVPKGTRVDHQTALGEDPRYNFVCEFEWINKKYSQINNILRHDVEVYGINIPSENLIKALRVRFMYDDSGNCKDIFRNMYANKKYCRMEVLRENQVQWYSVTDDWEEPDCPLRTDILIQVADSTGTVLFTEQQYKTGDEFFTEKTFPLSWQSAKDVNADNISKEIYRKEEIRYIIDKEKGFQGYVENTIGENGIVHYTDYLNFEEYVKQKGNRNLIIINSRELEEEIKKYKKSQMEEFKEITEKEFYDLYECLPPMRLKTRNGAFSFFISEAWNLTLHTFCFQYGDKYYKGIRDILQTDEELGNEIKEFINKITER